MESRNKISQPNPINTVLTQSKITQQDKTSLKDVKNKQGSALKFALESNKKTVGTAISK